MRLRGKTDKNQTEIVEALRAIGASVLITSNLGNGAPDLVVGFRSKNYLLEIKYGTGGLTKDEMEFMNNWEGGYRIVRTVDQAIAVLEGA